MREQDWTKEPWDAHQVTADGHRSLRICKADKSERGCYAIAEAEIMGLSRKKAEANARRIVACINACTNIPTESLEQAAATGVVAINGGTPVQLFRETKARLAEAETLLRDYGSIMEGFDTVNWPAMSKWKRERDAFVKATDPTEAIVSHE